MDIATILFTYNRPIHTEKVLTALRHNSVLPQKLFIFHDGKKNNDTSDNWEAVENIIHNVDWCDCEVITSEKNNGLALSIINGVENVFKQYDAIIVLEDDCVPHKLFMTYMICSLEKYANEANVYSIGATAEPVDVPATDFDAYFVGRINSWGWGTWKSKWKYFKRDYRLIGTIKKNPDLKKWLDVWGQDLEPTIINDMNGDADTWAAFWALSVINQKGLSLSPYYSLVDNIGLDGSGRHCGKEKIDNKMLSINVDCFRLPENAMVIDNYAELFAYYYPYVDPVIKESYYKKVLLKWFDYIKAGGNIIDNFSVNHIESIYLWGLGDLGERLIDELQDKIKISGIIVSNKKDDEYKGIKIFNANDVSQLSLGNKWIVVIPGYDIHRIYKLIDENVKTRIIPVDKIFNPPVTCYFPIGFIGDDGKKKLQIEKYGDEYGGYMLCPNIICNNPVVYSFGIGENISFDLDIMNRNDAVLFAFDPTPRSHSFIQKFKQTNDQRFSFFSYGLSYETSKTTFHLPLNEKFVSESVINYSDVKDESIDVEMKDIYTIAKENGHSRIHVLKMDIEGSEFKVIESMTNTEMLVIDQICLETHQRFFKNGISLIKNMNNKLYELGYELIYVSENFCDYTYARRELLGEFNN